MTEELLTTPQQPWEHKPPFPEKGATGEKGPAGEVTKAELAASEKNLIRPVFNVRKDYGAKGNGTNDAVPFQEALTAAKNAGGGLVWVPMPELGSFYLCNATLLIGNHVTLEGAGWMACFIKQGAEVKAAIIKSERYGEGGENGGTEYTQIRNIGFDGNIAENVGTTAALLELDGIAPILERVSVKRGNTNLKTIMSRNNKSSTRLEDGYFNVLWIQDAKEYGWLFEGPHDSHAENIWIKSDEGKNLSVRTVSVWEAVHSYGNAKRGIESWAAAEFCNCIGEGAQEGQVFLGDNSTWKGGFIFKGGGTDGKIGFVLGDAEHSAFEARVENVQITNTTNGAFKFNHAATRSVISNVTCSATEGKVWVEGTTKPNISVIWDKVVAFNGMENNAVFSTQAAAEQLQADNKPIIEVSAGVEIKNLQFGLAGQEVTLLFAAAGIKVQKNANLLLATTFVSLAAGDTLTLKAKTATIWQEVARSQPMQSLAPSALTGIAEGEEKEPSETRPTIVTGRVKTPTATRTKVTFTVGGVVVAEVEASVAATGENSLAFCFCVPAGKKWKWTKVEGTVTSVEFSRVEL